MEKYRAVPALPEKEKRCSKKRLSIDEMEGACIAHLAQILRRPVGDGDLISKAICDAYNIIISRWPQLDGSCGSALVPVVPAEDDQNEGPSSGQCCIDPDGCCDKGEE